MKNITITNVTNSKELEKIINDFNEAFEPSLKSRVHNLTEYSKKLYDNAITIKAVYNDKIVGFASFYCNDHIKNMAYLTQIAVKDEARGKGVGQMLINKVINVCLENKMDYLNLEVDNDNLTAFHLYTKNGFCKNGIATNTSFYMKKILGSEKNE